MDNLDTLYNADSWYCDGTFSACPQNCFQLYTVQALVEGSMIPLAFALLPNKKEKTYNKMPQAFKYYPKHVCLDFEIAASNAFRRLNKSVYYQSLPLLSRSILWSQSFPLDYFGDIYFGREKRGKVIPRFQIETWNCYEPIQGKPRTNNFLEGWHFGFSQFANDRHPSLSNLIMKFKVEQKN